MLRLCFNRMLPNRKHCAWVTGVLVGLLVLALMGFQSPIVLEIVYDSPRSSHDSPRPSNDQPRSSHDQPRSPNDQSRGRTADQGTWYSVHGAYEIYLYTAFYDARVSLASLPVIRVIAVMETLPDDVTMYCVVTYAPPHDPQLDLPGERRVPVTMAEIGAGASRHRTTFREYVLTCPLATERVPLSVGLVLDAASEPEVVLPVEDTRTAAPRQGLAICVSVSFWMIEPYKIVEWMELQRILGIAKIIVYNNTLAPQSSRVLMHYARTDFLDFRQSHNFMTDRGEETFHLHMSPVINDCMYRYMYQFKNILVIDFDEVIVPHSGDSLVDVLRAVEQQEKEEDEHPARSYVFQNAYFFFNQKPDSSQHPRLRTLQYRVRQEVSPEGYSAKSIIDPMACYAMHNHYCWGVTALYEVGNHRVFVPTDIALLHHYKTCHFDEFENKRGECDRLRSKGIQDDTMLKYKDRLVTAVDKQLALIGL